ncbi:MAG: hypothetical protein NT007_06550 [Candidatus Kapabacteria bacterium]|nr:hypothetical protein [Candidatus Kapabacteria bacterium]
MLQTQISISKTAYKKLALLSAKLGKKENEVANLAILNYQFDKVINKKEFLKKGKGIWADRVDIPDSNELRNSWEREFNG